MLSATPIEVSSETRETDSAQQHYRDLIAAVRLITKIQREVDREEDLGSLPSPAWRLLRNATNYLLEQAQAVLRGDDEVNARDSLPRARMEAGREAKY